jgi:2-oxoglutarate dehydrogenase C-terminal
MTSTRPALKTNWKATLPSPESSRFVRIIIIALDLFYVENSKFQISPFPFDLVKKECSKYPNAQLCWAQEEHKNQGAWSYVQPRFNTALNKSRDVRWEKNLTKCLGSFLCDLTCFVLFPSELISNNFISVFLQMVE